jgi:hypothetical protein
MVGPCWSHLGTILGLFWDYIEHCLAEVEMCRSNAVKCAKTEIVSRKNRFFEGAGFKIEAILVDNPYLGQQAGEQGATSKDFPRSLGKPGLVLGDVSSVGRPRGGAVHRGHPPPIRVVRGSPWSHVKSKIPIP